MYTLDNHFQTVPSLPCLAPLPLQVSTFLAVSSLLLSLISFSLPPCFLSPSYPSFPSTPLLFRCSDGINIFCADSNGQKTNYSFIHYTF